MTHPPSTAGQSLEVLAKERNSVAQALEGSGESLAGNGLMLVGGRPYGPG